MEFKLNEMCDWERKKAIFLMSVAEDIDYDLHGWGEVAVNTNSGYVYIWNEDFNFTLYMPIQCELKKSDVHALWSNFEDGEEREMQLKENTTLNDIEDWAKEQEKSINRSDD